MRAVDVFGLAMAALIGLFTMTLQSWSTEWWRSVIVASLFASGAVIHMIVGRLSRNSQDTPKSRIKDQGIRDIADGETRRLAGIVNAIKERALDYNFRLPLPKDDPFLSQYRELETSAHPIWIDRQALQL
jgi:hypothetical protein